MDWAAHVRSTVLTASVDPERTLRYLKLMFDSPVEAETMLEGRGKEETSLDIRLFAGLQGLLQSGPVARRFGRTIDRECTFENGRYGAGRFAWRLLEKQYRHTARIMAQEAAAKLHKEWCSGIGNLSAYLDMLETNLAILERCKEAISESMLLQILEERLGTNVFFDLDAVIASEASSQA